MRKQPIVEDAMKTVIRDELALNPLASVQKVRMALYLRGCRSVNNGTLDWHYVGKLMKKVRNENVAKLSTENRKERLVALKERHRILTEKLLDIVEGKPAVTMTGIVQTSQRDRIAATNMILKWDMALVFAEAQLDMIENTQTIEKKRTRAVMVLDEISETKTISTSRSTRKSTPQHLIMPAEAL